MTRLKELAAEMRGAITPEVRRRFIEARAELFQRGIYDPVLVRFDSATVPRATNDEIANQLEAVADALTPSA
jgi:hypothetical protein